MTNDESIKNNSQPSDSEKIKNLERKLRIIPDKDFQSVEIKEDKWIVEGYIPECSIVSINGKPGSLKTCVALIIAYCVAEGLLVFDSFKTEKCKVLYINQDNSDGLIKSRIKLIKKGLGITGDCDVVFSSLANLKLDNKKELQALEEYISYTQPKLIIVDCYRRVVSYDENDSRMVSLFLDEIRRLCTKYRTTWIFLHHLRKGFPGKTYGNELDDLRGSSDFGGAGDVALIFDRKKDSNIVTVKQAKCRHQKEESLQIQFDWGEDFLRFTCSGEAPRVYASTLEQCAEDIMRWAAENNKVGFKAEEVKGALTQYSLSTINRALTLLFDGGRLEKEVRGHYNVPVRDPQGTPQDGAQTGGGGAQ